MNNNFLETTKYTEYTKEFFFKKESYKIIGACFEVYKNMGSGFLEAVYQECLRKEFSDRDVPFVEKPQLELYYKDEKLEQKYEPDFLCYDKIVLELKAHKSLKNDRLFTALCVTRKAEPILSKIRRNSKWQMKE